MFEVACDSLQGVGPITTKRLQKIGVNNVQDLLFHLPAHYQDRTHLTPLGKLQRGKQATVVGTITTTEKVWHGKSQLLCCIDDETGRLTLRFFHFNKMQMQNLAKDTKLQCFGEVRFGSTGYEMIHPEYRILKNDEPFAIEKNLTPIYPTTEGLNQKLWRKIISQALELLQNSKDKNLQEILPAEILAKNNFPNLTEALLYIHRPPANADIHLLETKKHHYQLRLIFAELLAYNLSLRCLRKKAQKHKTISIETTNQLTKKFLRQLPFTLTKAQHKVINEISFDLKKSHPMLRLVQGDVGSGKTIVAAYATLIAVENNCQAALMAPTEILAEQHFNNFKQWLTPLGIQVTCLTGQTKNKARNENLQNIKNGATQIIIGTHALFQESVEFQKLSLVIVDEQHRFGVHQRLALQQKGIKNQKHPHQLIMTATPIPRTLAMTTYVDLDHSIIDELPAGRKSVSTVAIANHRRNEIIERIKNACQEKQQAYWVCTLIDESENLQCQAAEKTASFLKQQLPNLKVALVHGRMKSQEKEMIMADFKEGNIDLLVATTVIEVGVDVPNASLMVIENPERLGLAQLHQLRGRIGRGDKQSHCVLLYQSPLSDYAKERLCIMRETNDGFEIAQKDLELRGSGEVLGTKQSGIMQMRIADIQRDQHLLPQVQNTAQLLMEKYPNIVKLLIERWVNNRNENTVV